jgi:hypothetical protein
MVVVVLCLIVKDVGGLVDDVVAALWRRRADEVEPTPIGTAFRHYILAVLR